jgi:hypothetical protein
MWLYQLNQEKHPPGLFRRDIWEGQHWHFSRGQIRKSVEGAEPPKLGEVVVFLYSEASGSEPGIYGWAVIDRIDEEDPDGLKDRLHFIPAAPTNHLKMDPWWDDHVKEIAKRIKEPMHMATLFEFGILDITQNAPNEIRIGIKNWLKGR